MSPRRRRLRRRATPDTDPVANAPVANAPVANDPADAPTEANARRNPGRDARPDPQTGRDRRPHARPDAVSHDRPPRLPAGTGSGADPGGSAGGAGAGTGPGRIAGSRAVVGAGERLDRAARGRRRVTTSASPTPRPMTAARGRRSASTPGWRRHSTASRGRSRRSRCRCPACSSCWSCGLQVLGGLAWLPLVRRRSSATFDVGPPLDASRRAPLDSAHIAKYGL